MAIFNNKSKQAEEAKPIHQLVNGALDVLNLDRTAHHQRMASADKPHLADHLDPLGWLLDMGRDLLPELAKIPVSVRAAEIAELDRGINTANELLKTYPAKKREAAEKRDGTELARLQSEENFTGIDLAQLKREKAEAETADRKDFNAAATALHQQAENLYSNFVAKEAWLYKTIREQRGDFWMLLQQFKDAAGSAQVLETREQDTAELLASEYERALEALVNGGGEPDDEQPQMLTSLAALTPFSGRPDLATASKFDALLDHIDHGDL